MAIDIHLQSGGQIAHFERVESAKQNEDGDLEIHTDEVIITIAADVFDLLYAVYTESGSMTVEQYQEWVEENY